MSSNDSGSNRQGELFPRSRQMTVTVAQDHPLVVLTQTLDWTELEQKAEAIRRKKLKSKAGPGGGGTVMHWDRGVYTAGAGDSAEGQELLRQGYAEGRLE